MKNHKFETEYAYVLYDTKETREKIPFIEESLKGKKKTKEEIENEIRKYFKNAILKDLSPVSLSSAFKFITNRPPYEVNMYFMVSEHESIVIKAKVYYN